jgi:chaperonin GroES
MRLTGNRLLLKEVAELAKGGLIIPGGKKDNLTCEVKCAGPGRYASNGDLVANEVKVGDKVMIPSRPIMNIVKVEGEEFILSATEEVLVIL